MSRPVTTASSSLQCVVHAGPSAFQGWQQAEGDGRQHGDHRSEQQDAEKAETAYIAVISDPQISGANSSNLIQLKINDLPDPDAADVSDLGAVPVEEAADAAEWIRSGAQRHPSQTYQLRSGSE